MFSTSSTVYTAKNQSRCLAAVVGDRSRHRFFVGTCSTVQEEGENELAVLEFEEESNALLCLGGLRHSGQVQSLAASPYDGNIVATSSLDKVCIWNCSAAADWKCAATESSSYEDKPALLSRDMSSESDWGANSSSTSSSRRADLSQVQQFKFEETQGGVSIPKIKTFLWCPKEHENRREIITLTKSRIQKWDIETSKSIAEIPVRRGNAVAWSPHSIHELALATVDNVKMYDQRGKDGIVIQQPHDGAVLDIDYNPNKPFNICTAAEDGNIKFWDTRFHASPLKIVRAHSSFCTKAKYNPSHDQLLISAGADHLVQLWRISSISSAPLLELNASSPTPSMISDDDQDNIPQDPSSDHPHRQTSDATAADLLVKTFDLHDDSVYGLAWSAHDAWAFASLSYDGRLVLNHVPSPEKYKILL